MTAKQAINELKEIYLRVTFTIPGRLPGSKAVMAGLPVTVTIPTGPVDWELLNDWLEGKAKDEDSSFCTQWINRPLIAALTQEFRRKYPAVDSTRRRRIEQWLSATLIWTLHLSRNFTKYEFVRADGSSAEDLIRPLEIKRVGNILGEGEGDLGWVDPKGVLVPKWLYAELDVTLISRIRFFRPDRQVTTLKFAVRCAVPWDVPWEEAENWARLHVEWAFRIGVPFNLDNVKIVDPEVAKAVAGIQPDQVVYCTVDKLRWVTANGEPFPIGPVMRRHVKRLLDR